MLELVKEEEGRARLAANTALVKSVQSFACGEVSEPTVSVAHELLKDIKRPPLAQPE